MIFLEKAHNWQFGFQVPYSPVMEGIINFHHDLFFFLVCILFFVSYLLTRSILLFDKNINKNSLMVTHAPLLEIVWTVIPALILIFIAIPSFSLLYSIDEVLEPLLTIKVIGHQWYWSYEYLDPRIIFDLYYDSTGEENPLTLETENTFDSYMIADEDLTDKMDRLLDVDNKLYLPIETNIRILVTSGDVLHSWAIPSLGVKLDACPGRLNQTSIFIKRPGEFYGQCSEICGVNHGFMPIKIEGIDILGDGTKLDLSKCESIIPVYGLLFNKTF